MRRHLIKDKLSLESQEPAQELDQETDYAGSEDAQEAEAAMEAEQQQIDDAVDVMVALEELAACVPAGAALDLQSAKILDTAAGQLFARVGFAQTTTGVALEDFEPQTFKEGEIPTAPPMDQRQGATTGMLASIRDKAKKVWAAIIEALLSAKRWLKEHVRQLFDDSETLIKKAEALGKRATSSKESFIKFTQHMTQTRLDEITSGLQVYGTMPTDMAKAAHTTANLVLMQLNRVRSESLHNGEFFKKITNPELSIKYDPARQKEYSGLTERGEETGVEGQDGYTAAASPGMLGGYQIVQQLPTERLEGEQALRAMLETPKLVRTSRLTRRDAATMPLYSTAVVANAVKEVASAVRTFRDLQPKLDKLVDELVARARMFSSDKESPNAWQKRYLAAGPRMFVSEPARVVSYALKTCRTLLYYGKISVDRETGKYSFNF